MGSKGSQTTTSNSNQSQTYTPNAQIGAAGSQALSMATDAAGQPFQMPQAPVAGFTPYQTQAFGQVQGLQGMAQPYINQGQNYLQQSANLTPSEINQFYNPMADSVTAQMQNIFGQQNQQNTANLTQAAGGVGADRIAIGQGNMANQQGLAAGQTYAGLYQQALQAAQQQKQMQAGAGYGIAQLGPVAQNAALQGTSALGAAGTQQQALQQAQLNSPYQQQLAQIAYPFQTAQYLAGITGGLAPAMGGTTQGTATSSTTQPSPSLFSQILGAGTGAVGLAGSLGAFDSSGKGSQTGATYGAPSGGWGSYGGVPYPTFRRGGVAKFASGGSPYELNDSVIPYIPLQPGSGAFHNNLKMDPPKQEGGGGGGGLGQALGTAAKILPFFLASGGSVSPYDIGQGFDDGGMVDEGESWTPPPNPDEYNESAGLNLAGRLPPQPSWGEIARRAGDYYSQKAQGMASMLPQGSEAVTASDMGNTPPMAQSPYGTPSAPPPMPPAAGGGMGEVGMSFPSMSLSPPPMPVPMPPPRPAPQVQTIQPARGVDHGAGVATLRPNADMSTDDYMMPQSKRPYPGAKEDNWGTRAARSPWLSLVKAGAAMATSTGPIGSVIGKGMAAGVEELESQRKSLQSEEGINQRAQALYQQAKTHLDKYQRKTPHEVATEAHQAATLARGKYTPTNYVGEDGKYHVGVFDGRTGQIIDPSTRQPVDATRLSGRNAGMETVNSVAGQAKTAAMADPRFITDPLGTINTYRQRAGLPPLGAGNAQPGAGSNLPPMPNDKSQLQKDTIYQTPRGPAKWDGEKFISVSP